MIFLTIIILVFYGILYYFKRKIVPKIKGSIGEYKVVSKLKFLSNKDYIVLNNLLLKNGKFTTQIDHVIICKSGIIVIETKNYKGWIHGHQNSEYWTQTIYKHKNKLKNPIKQNWIHVNAIKKIFAGSNYIEYYQIVVFTGNCELKNITTTLPVIRIHKLIKTIKQLNNQKKLSYSQMQFISDKILNKNIISRKTSKNHILQVKKQIQKRKKKEKQKICPKCEGKLIIKTGKYGKFYGCDNFPKCKYSMNIKKRGFFPLLKP